MESIYEYVNSEKEGRFDIPNVLVGKVYVLIKLIVSPIIFLFKPMTLRHLKKYSSGSSYDELLPFMDRSFNTGDECAGCGNCARICPVNNIKLVDDWPSWQHHCEFCLACFHWCPKEAIESSELKDTVRYHHPDVNVRNMLRQD